MKKLIYKLICLTIVSMMTFCISSCGKDVVEDIEKEQEGGSEINKITFIGTWKYVISSGYCLLTINEDNTAIYNEWDDGKWDAKDEKYTYVYDEVNNVIYFYDYNTGEQWDRCEIVSITAKEMRTRDFLDRGVAIWKRQ